MPVVGNAPWESEAESGREAAFNTREVVRIVQAELDRNRPLPSLAAVVRCTEATYLIDNGKWIVECRFNTAGTLRATGTYVFDDATGRLVD